jgi:RHS repeat-associated protein
MNEWIRGVWLSQLVLALALLSQVGLVSAQSSETDYCFEGTCYSSKAGAESAMKAANPLYADYFRPKDPAAAAVYGALDNLSYTYYVPEQPPQSYYPPVYTFDPITNPAPQYCTASGVPTYTTGCASEAQMISNLIASEQANLGAATAVPSYTGSYVTPFSETHTVGAPYGWLRHNYDIDTTNARRLVVVYNNPSWTGPKTYTYRLRKFTVFTCPSGFTAKTGSHPSYNPNAGSLLTAPGCTPSIGEKTITTKLRQNCPQCANPKGMPGSEGNNPAYPVTGDKARFETDFEFAGRPFVRSYHSLRQAGQLPELAPGWLHSYSDRVIGGIGSSTLTLVDDRGYLSRFKKVPYTTHYISVSDAAKTIDTAVENGKNIFRLSDGTDLVRRYDASGRLARINSLGSAWRIDFLYSGDQLISATDHLGKALLFEYANGKLITLHLPDGNQVDYSYDTDNNFQSVQYADGVTRTYHYNESGYSDANDPHSLTGISDNGQRFLTFAYDNKNRVRLSQIVTGAGPVEKTELAYTGDTQVVVTGHHGETRTYALSSSSGVRRATAMTASDGAVTATYTGALLTESHDKRQNVTRYEYSTDGSYASARYDAYGTTSERKTVTARDLNYRVTSRQIQAKSGGSYVTKQQQSFSYNARGQQLTSTTTDPATSLSRTNTTTYCEQADVDAGTCPLVGLVKSTDGARTDVSDVSTYTYRMADEAGCASAPTTCQYRKGDLWKVTNALGQVSETLKYDGAGRPLSIKDPNGIITDFEYDARGRMTARKVRGSNNVVETDDQITRIEYWPIGLVKKVIQPDGAFTAYTYDDAHRLAAIADNAGNSITYTLNAASDRTKEDTKDSTGSLQRTLSRTYNILGQLQSQTDAYGRNTGFTYDANGNLDQTTDALSRTADNNYDPLDRLSRTLQDMSGIAAETKFSYDVLDNLTQVNDPKLLNTNYTYNGFSDLTQLSSPDTGTTNYTYDSAGNRASQTDARSVVTNYAYDALNRLTSVVYPATTALNATYTYDTTQAACVAGETFTLGRLTKIADGSGNTVYCYDRFGNMVRKVQTTNGNVFTLRYTYNVAGQLTSVIYPDGAVADYVYDTQGRVTEVGAKTATGTRQVLLTGASYYPFGPVAEWTYGNGRLMKRSLNQNYQPGFVEVTTPGGISIGYEFDEVGNLKKLRTADQTDPPRRLFAYDALNRLTETKDGTTSNLLEGYAYDKTGNRTSATVGAATTAYNYLTGNHRLDSMGAVARAYDNAGNTTQIGGTAKTFVYNDLNRMSQYSESGVVKMNYAYNGRGEQVRKYASGTTNVYSLYGEAGQWLGEYDNAGATTQQVIWLGSLPVGLFNGSSAAQKLYYLEADALGSPRVVVDPTRGTLGTAVWTWDLAGEAFGNTAPNQDPDGDAALFVLDMRFAGQRYDAATGLNYNYFRDYEAGTGRYVESDPIGLNGGISTYGYVGGNPMTRVDPLGLCNCAALRKFVSHMRGHPDAILVGKYNPTSENLLPLNDPCESIYGPVDIDWMLRLSYANIMGDFASWLSYRTAKFWWNVMRSIGPDSPYRFETDSIYDPANENAILAGREWLGRGGTLDKIFAPALEKCKDEGCKK